MPSTIKNFDATARPNAEADYSSSTLFPFGDRIVVTAIRFGQDMSFIDMALERCVLSMTSGLFSDLAGLAVIFLVPLT